MIKAHIVSRDIDFAEVVKELSREILLKMLNELADADGFSRTWEAANVVAIVNEELEARGEHS